MPNPLMGARIVTSKSNVDRPTAIEPVTEDYAGDNIPYRGVVDHGAPVKENFRDPATDMPDHDGRMVEVYHSEDEHEPDPIPVRIVGRDSAERPVFRTDRITLAANSGPKLLLGRDDRRQSAFIRNDSASTTLLIASDADSIDIFGFRLAQANFSGLTLGRGAASEIWVKEESGAECMVTVVWETSVG